MLQQSDFSCMARAAEGVADHSRLPSVVHSSLLGRAPISLAERPTRVLDAAGPSAWRGSQGCVLCKGLSVLSAQDGGFAWRSRGPEGWAVA